MSEMREMAARIDWPVTDEQARAGAYLERVGQRFCVDFGTDNVVEKAQAHWRQRRRDQKRKERARKCI